MLDSLFIAATGMHAEQEHVDTVSNNMANLNTVAYKKNSVRFSDLVYNLPVVGNGQLNTSKVSAGTIVNEVSKIFKDGDLKATQNPLDLAIKGKGFFEIELAAGDKAYTRNGSLRIDDNGYLVTVSGQRLSTNVQLPADVTEIDILSDGVVKVKTTDDQEMHEIGQIEIANFFNPTGLEFLSDGVYKATDKSGVAYYEAPGEGGAGRLEQGFLETSNVDLIEELIELTMAQRAYQMNSNIIRASDEMMQIINNLKR